MEIHALGLEFFFNIFVTNGIEYENKKIEFSCFLKETKINKFNFLNNTPPHKHLKCSARYFVSP